MPDPSGPDPVDERDPEDTKLLTLARSARARAGASEGAAVRDDTGRTYVAATVSLPSLPLTALAAAVVLAASSGARGLEAAAVVRGAQDDDLPDGDLAAVRDLGGAGTPVLVAGPDGSVRATLRA